MYNIVFFSGGVSSALTALWIRNNLPGKLHLLFTDTLTEDEDLYRFLDESIDAIAPDGVTHITSGMNVWDVFNKERFLGNSRIDPCSKVLKREPARKWINARYSPEETTLFFGIHWSEEERLSAIKTNWNPYKVRSVMCEPDSFFIDASAIKTTWYEQTGVKIPRLYDMGFTHNNCGGFCIKAGKYHFKKLLQTMPERYDYHANKEEQIRHRLGDVTILREQRDKTKYRLTMKEFASRSEVKELECHSCRCFG
ncbi:MAG: hypothetical protein V7K67_11130 [Nostoc sp.]|uniref:hypothetical protein n=1 Tax=Nostoc sp. TaxID=1180 RepID=UPI002FF82CE7